jgi:hypothetical protein
MTEQRIKELETENNRLRAMLARAGVSLLPAADLPDADQLARLLKMVEQKYPQLKCPEDSDKKQFAHAIRYLAFVYRLDRPNTLYATSFWVDGCGEWLRSQGIHSEMGLRPFTAAVVASGIVFGPSFDDWPYGINIGINLGSASRPSAAWRDVLKNGVPSPVELKNRAPARHHQLNMVRETI